MKAFSSISSSLKGKFPLPVWLTKRAGDFPSWGLLAASFWIGGATLLLAQSDYATPYAMTTLAGNPPGSNDGAGSVARFYNPAGAAVDSSGNIYVADSTNNTIRKITPAGVVTTLAGSPGVTGSSNGTGGAAQFDGPFGLAVDGNGNVYVADGYNNEIRKITPAGVVTTFAGNPAQSGSADGTGTAAEFSGPTGLAVDSSGNLYVADTDNDTIRKITPGRVVTTLAGTAGNYGFVNGMGASASFAFPTRPAVDSSGNIYVADEENNAIRKVTPAGVVTTVAGSGTAGSANGTGTAAEFSSPDGVAVDSGGNLYVGDSGNDTIRKISSAGVVSNFVGSTGNPGSANGTGAAARFNSPAGVGIDSGGNLFVADFTNNTIRKVTPAGVVTTLAGTPTPPGSANGTGQAAEFNDPQGAAVDGNGNVYVSDEENDVIRKITPAGVVTTLAGTAGVSGSANGTGAAARFKYPVGVAVDGNGNVYVADEGNDIIRKITSAGVVTTLAGTAGVSGSANGAGANARFNDPGGVAVDGSGNVYVADTQNQTIRKITSAGVVTTLAGTVGVPGSANGTGANALFSGPSAVTVDSGGNVYVADTGNSSIRKITPAEVVTTLAGDAAANPGSTDGTGAAARFKLPSGVAVDASGNVFVADTFNDTIRKVTPAGVVTTLAGSPLVSDSTDSNGAAARFSYPGGVAVDGNDNIYVADSGNCCVRMGKALSAGLYFQSGTSIGLLSLTTGFAPSAWKGIGTMNSGWQERAIADVNGDGIPDAIFQNGTSVGALILDEAGNPTAWVGIGAVSSGWELRGAGYITEDGYLDLIFQNGQLLAYLEVNASGAPLSWTGIGSIGTGWELRAVADLTGEGPDLLFQNGTSIGALQVSPGGVPTAWNGIGTLSAGWTLSYAVDVNGDGQPDLIFQDGTSLGALTVNTSFQPVAWYGIGAMSAGWVLPGDY